MYYVYVIKNVDTQKLYVGYTNNLRQRIKRHQLDKSVNLIYYEAYTHKKEALDREIKLKMYGSAWRGLKQRLKLSLRNTA